MVTATPDHPLEVSSEAPASDPRLAALISEIRQQADRFVFLMGGAADLPAHLCQPTVNLLQALTALAVEGYRPAVGDGGTDAGVMKAAGLARNRSGNIFPLIGVAPAVDVPPRGSTPLDRHHSHIVTVADPGATEPEAWGTETATMYWLFAKMAEGRPSVAVIINGGRVALKEVVANLAAGRPVVVVEGSGRAADAIASLVSGSAPKDDEIAELAGHLEAIGGLTRPDLFRLMSMTEGAEGLRRALLAALGG